MSNFEIKLRSICQDRCEGDPPCYEMDRFNGVDWNPCDECKRDMGMEIIEPLDPEAVIAPLI